MDFITFLSKDVNIIFDPIPSYAGEWSFNVENFKRNAIIKDQVNLWEEFFYETYQKPIQKIFKTKKVLEFNVNLVSKPNINNIGRCLNYNKKDFFVELTIYLNQYIDNVNLNEKEQEERIKNLLKNLNDTNENINVAYMEALKEKCSKLKDVLENEFNSVYYDGALKDYSPYKKVMSFNEYINSLYNDTLELQKGLLKLGDFFDAPISYNNLLDCFDVDKFFLLFAKNIYESNKEKILNNDGNINYLYYYFDKLKDIIKENINYEVFVLYILDSGKKLKYSIYDYLSEFSDFINSHKDFTPIKFENINNKLVNNYKDISLMGKINELKDDSIKDNWLISNEKIIVENSDTKLRINILENSGYIKKLRGINKLDGYYAFIYPNNKVIIENFNKVEATYRFNLDDFINMSKIFDLDLKTYINSLENKDFKRIFHTSINNWQRNLINEINGTYRLEDALNFINDLKVDDNKINSVYKRLLDLIIKEKESFNTLINIDNVLGLNVNSEEIINYLDFASDLNSLNAPLIGNVIVTEGDILSILKIINDLKNYEGNYLIYINDDNIGTISYLIDRANIIYKELEINVSLKIDYSENYNHYLNTLLSVIGSNSFILETSLDFTNANNVVV